MDLLEIAIDSLKHLSFQNGQPTAASVNTMGEHYSKAVKNRISSIGYSSKEQALNGALKEASGPASTSSVVKMSSVKRLKKYDLVRHKTMGRPHYAYVYKVQGDLVWVAVVTSNGELGLPSTEVTSSNFEELKGFIVHEFYRMPLSQARESYLGNDKNPDIQHVFEEVLSTYRNL